MTEPPEPSPLESSPESASRAEIEAEADTLLLRLESHRRAASPFEERGELGAGGMGQVIETFDRDLRRTVALKLLRAMSDDSDLKEELRDRFLEEAQITAQLDHPGVPPIHELGMTADGEVYYVMPRLRGGTLQDAFRQYWEGAGDWTLERCLSAIQRVCETLAFAHSRGVVHRDVKPANVMVGEFGEVLVIDWGLARLIRSAETDDQVWTDRLQDLLRDSEALLLTSPKGTPGFMAPEQASFEATLQDERVDVYAVGAMLYLLLGRQIPHAPSFEKQGAETPSIDNLRRILEERPLPLREIAPGAPPELHAICEKAMSPDRRDRYEDMQELAEDLRAYLEVRPVQAYRTGAWTEFSKWIRRNRGVASLAGALILGGLASALGGLAIERNRVRAVTESRDHQYNLAGALRIDSILLNAPNIFAAPSQLENVRKVVDDARTFIEQSEDLPSRLERVTERLRDTSNSLVAEDYELQVVALERQIEHVPIIEAELDRALNIDQRIVSESRFRPDAEFVNRRWEVALEALAADERFEGTTVVPRDDLLPLGPTKPADLWAFLALETGDFSTPLTYDSADEVGPDRGLILVLLPGGLVTVGAHRPNDATTIGDPHRDLWAKPKEGAPTVASLAPYFIGRHEVSRAQWQRIMGDSPGTGPAPEGADLEWLPVDSVSRFRAQEFVRRLSFDLPTEAQWEAAYRAGTTTPCFANLEIVKIGDGEFDYDWRDWVLFANTLDREGLNAELHGANRTDHPNDWSTGEASDGFAHVAPVASFLPNAFGLFDMGGNVWEWCRDEFKVGWGELAPGDGRRIATTGLYGGVIRGGSWYAPPSQSRASAQMDLPIGALDFDTGFRVAASAQ